MSSLFPARELNWTEILERKQMEGKNERKIIKCAVAVSRIHRLMKVKLIDPPQTFSQNPPGCLLPWVTYKKEKEKNASEGFAQNCGQESAIIPLPFWGHDNTGVDFPDISAKNSDWKSWGKRTWCKVKKRQGFEGTVGRGMSSWTSQGTLTNTNASNPCTLLMCRRVLVSPF